MMNRSVLLLAAGLVLALPGSGRAQEEVGHMHGPDGRHLAVSSTFGQGAGKSILSHHDLMISDLREPGPDGNGKVVVGCDVHSYVYPKGDPKQVIHREHNSFEPENGVYGSHMMYRTPGDYVIVENVTMPDGARHTLEFPVWVPDPHPARLEERTSPLMLGLGAAAVIGLLVLAFILGRRSGRRTAATLTSAVLLATLLPAGIAGAQQEGEAGHMHGPDGRHIAVAGTFGSVPEPLKAFPGPNQQEAAVQVRQPFRFQLSIENEELAPPDPDVISFSSSAAAAIGLKTVTARQQPLGNGLSTTGQVRPNPNGTVTVSPRVAGRVVRVSVNPGQDIPAGHVVAVIDSTDVADAQAALTQARSEQRQAEAAHGRAQAEVRRAQSQVTEAEAGVDRAAAQRAEAQAEVDRAQADLQVARTRADHAAQVRERQRQLAEAGAFSQAPVEQARAAISTAEGALREAQAALAHDEAQERRQQRLLEGGAGARKNLEVAQAAAAQSRARVANSEKQLEIARAALAREVRIVRENLRDSRELQQAQSDLEAAQLTAQSAQANVSRQQRGGEAAAALVTAQQRAVQAARSRVDAARAEAATAEAAAAGARRAVQFALNRLELLGARPGGGNQVSITAPIGGEVESRPVNAGEVVAAGQTLCTILNPATMWIESDVFEKDLPRVRVGQRVTIAADAVPGRTFAGTISYIGHEVNPETRSVRVRTVVANPGEVLKPNMFARVIIAAGGGSAVTVPLEALQEDGAQQVVFVEESPSAYRRRVVRVGATLGDQVVIESGVRVGEKVVTTGAYQLLSQVKK